MSDAMLVRLMSLKGQIATITTTRPVRVRKNCEPITKTSTFQCRIGVDYENITAVRTARETGEMAAESAGLPWGTWYAFPHVIEHRGTFYFRCTRINNNFRPRTTYTCQGQEIPRAAVEIVALASEFRAGEPSLVFNIRLDSIVNVA